MSVGDSIEVFAEGVDGQDDARHARGQVKGGAEVFGEAFLDGLGAYMFERLVI